MQLDQDDLDEYDRELAKKDEANAFWLWPENLEAVRVFCQCMTQWRVVSGGLGPPIWLGLDYLAVEAVIRHRGHTGVAASKVFNDILVMEQAALDEIKSLKPRNA